MVRDDSTPALGQKLSNPRRFSLVGVAGWLAMPRSSARDFAVPSALGKSMTSRHDFTVPRGVKDIICVVVQPAQRQVIQDVLEIGPRRWRKLVAEWEGLWMAHKCERGNLTLFLRPDPVCPRCDALIEDREAELSVPQEVPISAAKRNYQFREMTGLVPLDDTISAAFERESGGLSAGAEDGLQRDEEGGLLLTSPFDSEQDLSPEGSLPQELRTSLPKSRRGTIREQLSGDEAQAFVNDWNEGCREEAQQRPPPWPGWPALGERLSKSRRKERARAS